MLGTQFNLIIWPASCNASWYAINLLCYYLAFVPVAAVIYDNTGPTQEDETNSDAQNEALDTDHDHDDEDHEDDDHDDHDHDEDDHDEEDHDHDGDDELVNPETPGEEPHDDDHVDDDHVDDDHVDDDHVDGEAVVNDLNNIVKLLQADVSVRGLGVEGKETFLKVAVYYSLERIFDEVFLMLFLHMITSTK